MRKIHLSTPYLSNQSGLAKASFLTLFLFPFAASAQTGSVTMLGPDYFSSITDHESLGYVSGRTSDRIIDGSESSYLHVDDLWFRAEETGYPVSFTVNMNLTDAPHGWTFEEFLLYNDFGTSSVDEGAESFSIEFFSELDAGGAQVGSFEVLDVPGPAYNSTSVDVFALTEPVENVKSFTFTVLSGFDFWGEDTSGKNGLHIREIGFTGPGASAESIPEASSLALLALGGLALVNVRKRKS